jgi:4,5-DOPA dioxygenase extradiol
MTPAVFIGHGSPMNALEDNVWTRAWREFGRRVGTPRAVLAISAHWYIGHTAVTAMPNPRTIHDFYGFPDELFAFDYPADGDAELAAEVADLLAPTWVGLDHDSWGLDHGTWSVLAHMFPGADVPVVQLAIDATKPVADHVGLGAALAPLRDRKVLIMCSGNVVHHLGRIRWGAVGQGEPWAEEFDAAAAELLSTRPSDLAELAEHPAWSLAVPAPDHFLPLAYFGGVAAASGGHVQQLVGGCTLGSLSMSSYTAV